MTEMTHSQRVAAAKKFFEWWTTQGREVSDTHKFWMDLLSNVLGMDDVSTQIMFEVPTPSGGRIDAMIADAKVFIEQKSRGVDLDKQETRQGNLVTPFEQAKKYADEMPNSKRPDTIIVCNFTEFRIYDLNLEHPDKNYESFTLEELPNQLHLLQFLADPQAARAKREMEVSLKAGELIGKLYKMLHDQYLDPESGHAKHSLNVLCVRLVFCLYAEDAGIFPKSALHFYLDSVNAQGMRIALQRLFKALDTPLDVRDPYDTEFSNLPYVNGGLFADEDVEIPPFTEEMRDLLINEISAGTDWSQISPTIFGGVFESTLNPETRHDGGMHYTSPENIHRVIDPLFLDELKEELDTILNEPGVTERKRTNNLKKFHDKIASLNFFDPACGSGNFLTETYISLRRLENIVIGTLMNHQTTMVFEDLLSPGKVHLGQFYGIEINDFAVSVAQTALWIAKLQADQETEVMTAGNIDNLPLRDSANIIHGNALRIPWAEILSPSECSYIIGNPPFLGYSNLNEDQKQDRLDIFGKGGGVLDYVACWYKLAATYMKGTNIHAGLVSTNSIVQGQQVQPLWEPLLSDGLKINFAHRTFVWRTDSSDPAAVHVIIVGFSYEERADKKLFSYKNHELTRVDTPEHINGYLVDAPDVFIERRTKPLHGQPAMAQGFKPADGGNLLMWEDEYQKLVAEEPLANPWIRRYSMGAEFINGKKRFCLWLVDISPKDYKSLPLLAAKVKSCREWRLAQTKTGDAYKLADKPHLLRPTSKFVDGTYIAVPKVSSERRRYIPMGFVEDGMIPGDKLYFVPTDSRFVFGILTSRVHNSWMRAVAGRLKSDYSYANTIVYNNLVIPEMSDAQRNEIEEAAQAVIDARKPYVADGATLADLYDPDNDWLYPELTAAHAKLDAAVERVYGLEPGCPEEEIVQLLFRLYSEAVAK